jgi:septal ring factor EnvC (AmiA/AmiB activator)
MIGPQEELELLLNQSNPTNLGRTLAYYRYFAQERSRKIEAIRAARAAAAADRCCNEELANLKREEQAVESLVADLARVLEEIPVDATQSCGAMRGKLPWPGG